MEAFPILTSQTLSPTFPMNTICFNFRTKIRFCSSNYRSFSGSSLIDVHEYVHSGSCRKRVLGDSCRVRAKVSDAELKEKWLNSLSCPLPEKSSDLSIEPRSNGTEMEWVVGIDPDLSGALALLKTDQSGCSAQVFDTPHLQVLVGKRIRRRLDAKSIVQLVRSFDTPPGTTAYIEQSIPYPQDGKQGWWSGGFGYGLWIGILVASGFSVVPVPSLLWKNHFQLAGARLTKDDSRKAASTLFPSLSSQLTRKKDHGRAEALLIAAYGQGLVLKSDDPDMESEELVMESESFEVIRKDHNIQPECLSLIAEDLYMKSEDLEVKPGHVMKSKRAVRSKDLLVKSEGLS